MDTWQYPFEIKYATVLDSIRIAYVDEGQGPKTLLFLHGLGSNLKSWQKNIAALSNEYRCIALDLPGYGKSSKGDYGFRMTFFARSVRALMDTLGLEQVVLAGHSMGGQIAMHLVLHDARHVEQLVLLAPAGFETFTPQEKEWFARVYTPEVVRATPEEQIVKNFELNFYDMPDDARFMIDDRMEMRRHPEEYDHYCRMIPQCVQGMLEEPVFKQLPRISVPTLVIFGENDLLIPNRLLHPARTTIEVAQTGAARIPDCRVEMLPQAGHFVQWEQAARVNELIRAFIQ
ncbi:MAG: alpha/beta hydrolase [Deltaproteobacteria bacterium]|nr:MAG: alpha/beta hydrolase [Deltaproteobacteria bacterium]